MGDPSPTQPIHSYPGSVFHLSRIHGSLQRYSTAEYPEGTIFMTMAEEIEKLLNDYRAWMRDKTTLRDLNGPWVEITTPYVDRHNDALQLYARRENDGYVLTDDS